MINQDFLLADVRGRGLRGCGKAGVKGKGQPQKPSPHPSGLPCDLDWQFRGRERECRAQRPADGQVGDGSSAPEQPCLGPMVAPISGGQVLLNLEEPNILTWVTQGSHPHLQTTCPHLQILGRWVGGAVCPHLAFLNPQFLD